MTFDEYKDRFHELARMKDFEIAHAAADDLLRQLVIDAARQRISVRECGDIIYLYDNIEKHFA